MKTCEYKAFGSKDVWGRGNLIKVSIAHPYLGPVYMEVGDPR